MYKSIFIIRKIRAIMIALLVAICLPLSAQTTSYKIVLGEDEVPSVFVLDNDDPVNFDDKENLPDSMKIEYLELNYGSGKEMSYLHVFSKNERVFYGSLSKFLNKKEIDNQGGLVLEKGNQYTFVREGKEWKLDISNNEPPTGNPEPDNPPDDDSPEDGGEGSGFADQKWLPWVLLGLTAFIAMVVIAEGIMLVFAQKNPSGGKSASVSLPEPQPQPPVENPEYEVLRMQYENLKNWINGLYPGETEGVSVVDKLDELREKVLFWKDCRNRLEEVRNSLGLSEGGEILDAIERLKQTIPDKQQPDEKEIKQKYAQELIEKINNCGNKELKAKLGNAKEEKVSEGALEIVDKFIKILAGTDFNPKENNQVDESTDLKNKILLQFKCLGYTEFEGRKSIPASDFFNELIVRLKESEEARNRPSDEELATQFIKNGSLNDEQKTLLTSSLIRLINKDLDDDQKIGEKSLEEFVSLMVEKIQEPNTLEEAQAMVRKYEEDLLKFMEENAKELVSAESFDSAKLFADALIKMAKEGKQALEDKKAAEKLVIEDLNKKISSRDGSHQNEEDLMNLIDKYSSIVKENESELKRKISEEKKAVGELTKTKVDNEQRIAELQNEKDALMTGTGEMVKKLHSLAGAIGQLIPDNILRACSDECSDQCKDLEDRLDKGTTEFVNHFNNFSVEQGATPSVTRDKIQKELVDFITKENSPVNTICRYYAYSRVPFMTDICREAGVTIKPLNISKLFDAVNNLYVSFGIGFSLPPLFVMSFKDGDYDDVKGEKYGEIKLLCPEAYNHCDKIDSQTKQNDVIVDIVKVGYSVDGIQRKKAEILTY